MKLTTLTSQPGKTPKEALHEGLCSVKRGFVWRSTAGAPNDQSVPLTVRRATRIVHVQGGAAVQKKLTITVDEEVYEGLRKTIGPRKISKFIQELVRPHVVRPNLESDYAEMAKDKKREEEAMEWAEITFKDLAHETA